MDLSLNSKCALVLGSSKGIGAAAAFELAALGARIILVARDKAALEKQRAALPHQENKHRYLCCDVKNRDELLRLVQSELAEVGTIHVFVNNTGGPAGGSLLEASDEQFLSTFEQHVLVGSGVAKVVVPGMKKARYGRIINVISTSVKIPIQNLGVSNTIRAAVASWAKTLANELASHGITVNNVLPGMTSTERLEGIIESTVTRTGKDRNAVETEMKATIPAARFGKAEEVASAIAFLASPAASYVNGIALAVDGGRTGCL